MTREEFLKKLEYLLQDIDVKDREDALNYYRDYMDDAGLADHDSVDGLLDMPEKVAISIRSSLSGENEENVEYSEQGYTNINVEPEDHTPEVYGEYEEYYHETPEEKNRNLGKWILIGILCLAAAPVILGVGGGIIGVVFGILGALIGVVFGIGGGAIGCLIGGVVLFVKSILHMVVSVPQGIFMMGAALLVVAAGILFVMLLVLICGRLIPWCIRSIVQLFRKLFRRNGGAGV